MLTLLLLQKVLFQNIDLSEIMLTLLKGSPDKEKSTRFVTYRQNYSYSYLTYFRSKGNFLAPYRPSNKITRRRLEEPEFELFLLASWKGLV